MGAENMPDVLTLLAQIEQLTQERNRAELSAELLAYQLRKSRERVLNQRRELRRLNQLRHGSTKRGLPIFLKCQAF